MQVSPSTPPSSSSPPPLQAQQPAYSFTIPSLHDDTALDCRIYHPQGLFAGCGGSSGGEEEPGRNSEDKPQRERRRARRRKKVAIIAHPYAPLGGNYDDPVVGNVGAECLADGWVVGTFGFRGAISSGNHHHHHHHHHHGAGSGAPARSGGGSKTSWTGKPELQDYISFVGLMVEYMRCLDADQHDQHQNDDSGGRGRPATRTSSDALNETNEQSVDSVHDDEPIYLILGGYSYGSLVASRLPPLPTLLSPFYNAEPPIGSTPSEILLRARHLASETNAELREPRGLDSFLHKHRSPVTIGGEESDPEARRRSKEATRSSRSLDLARGTERLKRAWDKKHHHQEHSASPGPAGAAFEEGSAIVEEPQSVEDGGNAGKVGVQVVPAYLLVSPLLPPTSLFIAPGLAIPSLPALLPFPPAHSRSADVEDPLIRHPTLAVWGTNDPFTGAKKLARWARGIEEASRSFQVADAKAETDLVTRGFKGVDVEGAGHFWQERGAMGRLRGEVREWVAGLDRG